MARTDTLINFVTDICNATRSKTGKTDLIPLSSLDTEIESISTSSSVNNLNIFSQETEPEIKEGLWLQTNKIYNKVAFETLRIGTNWITVSTRKSIPYSFKNGTGERVRDFVYLFGGDGGYNRAYKYDLVNDTYTSIASTPYKTGYSPSVVIRNFVYLFGYWDYYNLYRYNTLTNTYQTMAKPLSHLTGGGATVVNNYIYAFGSDSTTYCNRTTRYNIDTNTWERLSDCPIQLVNIYPVTHATDIYIISPYTHSGKPGASYKYDTITDTYTEISSPSDTFTSGGAYVDGDYIYLFGGINSISGTLSYRYDILTGTYTQLSDVPYSFSNNNNTILEYKGKHLVFGGNGSPKNVLDINMEILGDNSITYEPDTVIIRTSDTKNKSFKLFNDDKIITDISERNKYYFDDVVYVADGTIDTTIPTYYIEGNQWTKFKN